MNVAEVIRMANSIEDKDQRDFVYNLLNLLNDTQYFLVDQGYHNDLVGRIQESVGFEPVV